MHSEALSVLLLLLLQTDVREALKHVEPHCALLGFEMSRLQADRGSDAKRLDIAADGR